MKWRSEAECKQGLGGGELNKCGAEKQLKQQEEEEEEEERRRAGSAAVTLKMTEIET